MTFETQFSFLNLIYKNIVAQFSGLYNELVTKGLFWNSFGCVNLISDLTRTVIDRESTVLLNYCNIQSSLKFHGFITNFLNLNAIHFTLNCNFINIVIIINNFNYSHHVSPKNCIFTIQFYLSISDFWKN